MGSESMLQEILWDTKIGWWKVDMARRVLLLSDYLCKTIGTEESEIGYDRFLQSVGEPFRASLKSLMSTDASLFSAEQIFSLCGPRGEVWFRWKVLRRETAADKGLVVSGYAQEISEREALPVDLCSIERMNTLLYRLNNISHTLLSFLHIGSIDEAINKVLTDVLKIFRGSRTYIAEFDWDNRRHICTYEVTDKGVESGRDRFDRLSMDETPWWVEQLEKRSPIALSCLDDLPSRARNEHDILAAQNIGSLFVLPMTFRDKLWGYAGIDVIGEHRDWQNEDYQWFASLVNIINICIELCCGKDYRKIPSRLCGAAGERAGDRRYARVPESFRQSIAGGAACRKGGPFVGFRPVCSCRYVFDHSRGGDLPAFGYDRNV